MADKTTRPTREKIVLEYLAGGVTYRQLEAKHGIDHAHIHRWVMAHQGRQRDRSKEYTPEKSTIKWLTPEPEPLPPDPEKTKLTQQLQQAQLKVALLEEIIRVAQAEYGLVLPKKSITKPSKLLHKPGN
jgi:transposase-like protein